MRAFFALFPLFPLLLFGQKEVSARSVDKPVLQARASSTLNNNSTPLHQRKLGTLSGKVLDKETKEPLPMATVYLIKINRGTTTNQEGTFSLSEVPYGNYKLRVQYVSYQTLEKDIRINSIQHTIGALPLSPHSEILEGVDIVGTMDRGGDASLLNLQKESVQLIDGVSSEHIKRTGDNNAAQAAQRITGVTVEDGKYLYVRGLGDRYNKVFLNGAYLPSLDPSRNSVQMDIIPSQIIESVNVHKTFSSDLPGDFSGGFMNINTKGTPKRFGMQVGISHRYTPQAHFQLNTLHRQESPTEIFKLNTTATEKVIQDLPTTEEAIQDPQRAQELLNISEQLSSQTMVPLRKSSFLDHRYTFSIGNTHRLAGGAKSIGYRLGLLYRQNQQAYQQGLSKIHKLVGPHETALVPSLSLQDERGNLNRAWGGMGVLSYEPTKGQSIHLTYFLNQSANSTARHQEGRKPEDDPDLTYITDGLWYTKRQMQMWQVRGEHDLAHQSEIQWSGTRTLSSIDQPDLRFFTYGHFAEPNTPEESILYVIQPSIGQIPTRYFRFMQEISSEGRLDFKKSLGQERSFFKIGGAINQNDRLFREEQYRYEAGRNVVPEGNPDLFIQGENLWSPEDPQGAYLVDATQEANNYDGNQLIYASYAMFSTPLSSILTNQWEMDAGLRYEYTRLDLLSHDSTKAAGYLRLGDLLPSFHLLYKPTDKFLLKTSYGRTIARPTFRELAPLATFEFIGDFLLVGNPLLERTLTHNTDLRAEYFLSKNEILSLGVFYKYFIKPIERTFNPRAAGTELTFRNVDKAEVYGVELEFKKGLHFLNPSLNSFFLASNLTYVYSRVTIDPKEFEILQAFDPQAIPTRPMFGQSPFVINTVLSYIRTQWQTHLTYNVFGKRIAVVTQGDSPNIYEQPRNQLSFNLDYLWNGWKIRGSIRNILDDDFRRSQSFHGTEYLTQQYRLG
ncbi:MAG: TonB-dependent receptor, partial [Cytophagales bacterium]|nr:TonB-dependent receptor [Cytophagales bacterium]